MLVIHAKKICLLVSHKLCLGHRSIYMKVVKAYTLINVYISALGKANTDTFTERRNTDFRGIQLKYSAASSDSQENGKHAEKDLLLFQVSTSNSAFCSPAAELILQPGKFPGPIFFLSHCSEGLKAAFNFLHEFIYVEVISVCPLTNVIFYLRRTSPCSVLVFYTFKHRFYFARSFHCLYKQGSHFLNHCITLSLNLCEHRQELHPVLQGISLLSPV